MKLVDLAGEIFAFGLVMAYGGPATVAGSASASSIRQVKLDRESEFRIEVGSDSPLRLRLLSGNAEIFGTELPPEIWLTLPPRLKIAVSFNELGFPVAQFDLLRF